MSDIKEISREDLLAPQNYGQVGSSYRYDNVTLIRKAQEELLQPYLEACKALYADLTEAFRTGRGLYFKATAGSKAGSIFKLDNQPFSIHQDNYGEPALIGPEIRDISNTWSGQTNGSLWVVGQYHIPMSKNLILRADGMTKPINFDRNMPTNKTMKLVFLLGYSGPTLLVKGKPTTVSATMTDRFGQTVGVGDVVLLGQKSTGRLITGKISRISDNKGVWIKHIGSKTDHHEKSCDSQQLLLLKDVERVLMTEKLKTL